MFYYKVETEKHHNFEKGRSELDGRDCKNKIPELTGGNVENRHQTNRYRKIARNKQNRRLPKNEWKVKIHYRRGISNPENFLS